VPLALFLPLLFDAANRLFRKDVSWRWVVWTGGLIGISFHAGHAQMWTYAVMFFALAILAKGFGGGISWRRASWALSAVLVGLAIAAPLFFLQFQETRGILRVGGYGTGAVLSAMLLPLGTLARDPKLLSSSNPEYAAEMFHFGVVFAGAAAVGLVLMIGFALTCRKNAFENVKVFVARNPWLIVALIAVWFSLGDKGLLWSGVSLLPVFDKFRWPIKFAPFIALAAIFSGVIIVERWLGQKRLGVTRAITFASAALILFHVTLCRSTFYTMAEHPYPAFPESARQLLAGSESKPSRIIAIAPIRSPAPGYFRSLALNYPTQLRLLAFDGYDTFIATKHENREALTLLRTKPFEAASAYGCRWLVVQDLSLHPKYSPNPMLHPIESLKGSEQKLLAELRSHGRLAWHNQDLWLYELPDAQPIAFSSTLPTAALPIALDQSGIAINTDGAPSGALITASYLSRPWIQARLDGKTISSGADEWGRICVRLPRPGHVLRIEYAPPWGFASGIAGLLLLAAFGAGAVSQRLNMPSHDAIPQMDSCVPVGI